MKTIKLIGQKRKNLGKVATNHLRKESQVPCVLYGGKENIHFYVAMAQLKQLIYTPKVYFIDLQIEKNTYTCILQDLQIHPVNEMVLHLDFLQIYDDKPIKMEIPIVFTGNSLGVANGGVLVKKLRKLKIVALPKNMPENISVDITPLELGKTSKIKDIKTKDYIILDNPLIPIATVGIPRVLRKKDSNEEKAS